MTNVEELARFKNFAAKNWFICENDHGGYLAGYCYFCKVCGWDDKITHKKDCLSGLTRGYK